MQVAWAACLFFFAAAIPFASAQPKRFRPNPNYVQLGTPDQTKGRQILEEFRQWGIQTDYYWEFELRVLPRRGEEKVVPGRLWSGRNELGPVTRVVVQPGVTGREQRLLIQNGSDGSVWSWKEGVTTHLDFGQLFDRIGETDITAFDLQMPFLNWPDFVFEGVAKLRGRPAHVFLFYPPASVAALHPELTGVRVYLDTQFHAPVQIEQVGSEARLLKSATVLDLKKIGEDWIVKEVDFRDEETRNKTRFLVTAAAVRLDFSRTLFDPGILAEPIQAPSPERIERMAP